MKTLESQREELKNLPLRNVESDKYTHNLYLKQENERLTNSLRVIRDYVKANSEISSLHILEICVKTINNMSNYRPSSK